MNKGKSRRVFNRRVRRVFSKEVTLTLTTCNVFSKGKLRLGVFFITSEVTALLTTYQISNNLDMKICYPNGIVKCINA